MTERERLIELIASKVCRRFLKDTCLSKWSGSCGECECGRNFQIGDVADHLLANGVIVIDTDHVDVVKNRKPLRTAFNMPLDELAELIRAKQ